VLAPYSSTASDLALEAAGSTASWSTQPGTSNVAERDVDPGVEFFGAPVQMHWMPAAARTKPNAW
jgi:hypothetical protein